MAVSPVLRHRDFNLYLFGVVLSEIGSRGTVAANLYQVYALTGSLSITGLVGLAQAVALLFLSPLGGAYADRLDRRRLLQAAQSVSLLVAIALTVITMSGYVEAWHVILSALLTTVAATFDRPARTALIPAMVPRSELPQAFALLNPSRELAIMVGPAIAGGLIALGGPELMYLLDAVTYSVLIVILGILRTPPLIPKTRASSVLASIAEGVSFARHRRPLVLQLMSLDLSASLLGAYRVVLPALTVDVLDVGPVGYGLLASAPSAGALIATYVVFRIVRTSNRLGRVLLFASVGYGIAVAVLGQMDWFIIALVAAAVVGGFDAIATTIRQAVVQLETPDELRGRMSSLYQMASRGGPALGDANLGWVAGLVGPATALTVGGLMSSIYGCTLLVRGGRVRSYASSAAAEETEEAVAPDADNGTPMADPEPDPRGPDTDGAAQPK